MARPLSIAVVGAGMLLKSAIPIEEVLARSETES